MRLSVDDAATGLASDVHVDCAPSDRVGDILAMISEVLPVRGIPMVDGAAVALEQPVAVSPLREGSVLRYGGPPQLASSRHVAPLVLRVVSGVDAGTEVGLWQGQTVILGRAQSCQVVLDDPEVSRRHAKLVVGGGRVTLTDLGSRNGVLLGGRRIRRARDVEAKVTGEFIQLGGTRLVVEATDDRSARVTRGDQGELVVSRSATLLPRRVEPATVTMPVRPEDDEAQASPLAGLPLLRGWLSDRRRRRRAADYRTALMAARAEVEAAVDDEDADLRIRWPDASTTVRTATAPTTELWDRRPGDGDWLVVRLGTADRSPTVRIKGDPPEGWALPVLRRAPQEVSLVEQTILGLAGPPGWLDAQLSWVVMQLAVRHSPSELRLAVIAPDAGETQVGWMRWLPHIRERDGSVRAGWDQAGAERTIEQLGADLRQRPPEADHRTQAVWPDLVVVLADTADLQRHSRLTELLEHGPAQGVRFVCAEHDERHLPAGATARLVAADSNAILHVNQTRSNIATDQIPASAAELVARSLAPLRTEDGTAAAPARQIQRAVALHWLDVACPSTSAPQVAPSTDLQG